MQQSEMIVFPICMPAQLELFCMDLVVPVLLQ